MGLDRVLSALKKAADAACAKHRTSAVILAAGSSERFIDGGCAEKKQFTCVAGKPAVLRSAEAFENCGDIDEIIVVAAEEDTAKCAEILEGQTVCGIFSDIRDPFRDQYVDACISRHLYHRLHGGIIEDPIDEDEIPVPLGEGDCTDLSVNKSASVLGGGGWQMGGSNNAVVQRT